MRLAPRIAEVQAASRQDLHAVLLERAADGLPVIDDEAEVAVLVGRLAARGRERDELVAGVDERHPVAMAAT